MPRIGEKYMTPIPKREAELRSSGCGPVVTYYLSEEELEKVRETNGPASGLTKLALLEAIAAGETLSSVERAWDMKYNTIHTWVKKWELKGISSEQARELLEAAKTSDLEAPEEPEAPKVPEAPTVNPTVDPHAEAAAEMFEEKIAMIRQERDDYRHEAKNLQRQINVLVADKGDLIKQNEKLKAKIEDENATAARIVQAEVDLNKQKDAEIENLKAELAGARAMFNEACDSIVQLQNQLNAAAAVPAATGSDPVNHPAHYTAGAVECIDAIEAATTGLAGVQAYNTGAAIKYMWRWSRKGGAEDLLKARWYINRLLGEGAAH